MTARFALLRADCAGSVELAAADTLREAAELWSAAYEGRNWNRTGVMFLVTDDERDGATVDEEELQEALMTEKPGAFDSFLLGCVADCVEGKR